MVKVSDKITYRVIQSYLGECLEQNIWVDEWIMNWIWCERKRSWPIISTIVEFTGGAEKKYEEPQFGEPVFGPRFESGTF